METDFVMDCLLPLTLLLGALFGPMALIDGAMRLWAKARGQKYESPFVW